jgi:hypothetical protein
MSEKVYVLSELQDGPRGIRGWLIPVLIGVTLTTVMFFIAAIVSVIVEMNLIAATIGLVVSAVYAWLLRLMLRHDRRFPGAWVVAQWVLAVGSFNPAGIGGAFFWTLYMRSSKRVKNTFIQ